MISRRKPRRATPAAATSAMCPFVGVCGHGKLSQTVSACELCRRIRLPEVSELGCIAFAPTINRGAVTAQNGNRLFADSAKLLFTLLVERVRRAHVVNQNHPI